MAVADLEEPGSLGRVLLSPDGTVERIVEAADATLEQRAIRTVNAGIYALPAPEVFEFIDRLGSDNAQGEIYLTDAVGEAASSGLAMRPVVCRMKRAGIPAWFAAGLVTLFFGGAVVATAQLIAPPAQYWAGKGPESLAAVASKLKTLKQPLEAFDIDAFVYAAHNVLSLSNVKRTDSAEQEVFFNHLRSVLKLLPKKEDIPELERLSFFSTKGKSAQYDSPYIKKFFEDKLEALGVAGWKVIIGDPGQFLAVSIAHEHHEIRIPYEKSVEEKELQGLAEHEIGTHIVRRTNGELSPLGLLGTGLDQYLSAEEGFATYREQIITGMNHIIGIPTVAIGLAIGVGGIQRGFRETYSAFISMFLAASSIENNEERERAAKDMAWNRTVRIFRGTTCNTPGAVFLRDKVYLELSKAESLGV